MRREARFCDTATTQDTILTLLHSPQSQHNLTKPYKQQNTNKQTRESPDKHTEPCLSGYVFNLPISPAESKPPEAERRALNPLLIVSVLPVTYPYPSRSEVRSPSLSGNTFPSLPESFRVNAVPVIFSVSWPLPSNHHSPPSPIDTLHGCPPHP